MSSVTYKLDLLIFELKKHNLLQYLNSTDFNNFSLLSGFNNLLNLKYENQENDLNEDNKVFNAFYEMLLDMYNNSPAKFFQYIKAIMYNLYFFKSLHSDISPIINSLSSLNCSNNVLQKLNDLNSLINGIDYINTNHLLELESSIQKLEAKLYFLDPSQTLNLEDK